MLKYVVDTSSLMEQLEGVNFEEVIVPTLVLRELERHKSNHKDPAKQVAARHALHAIEDNQPLIEFDFNQYPTFVHLPADYDINYTDNRLLESLFHHQKNGRQIGLLAEDLSLRLQASSFGFPVKSAESRSSKRYQGTISIPVNDHRVAYFYRMIHGNTPEHENIFENKIGEYILLQDEPPFPDEEKIIGAWKWTGSMYKRISMDQQFRNSFFDEVRPKNFRQAIAMDSLKNNPLTAITGKAGAGKSYLALSYILQQMEYNERPVYIVTNNVPMRGTSSFGLKKGDIVDKILQSNLGSILRSKIGLHYTESLVEQEKINLVALEDIRGCSFNAIVYLTEAQNYSVDMVKTILERMEMEGQVILDGDERQIDTNIAKGKNNGLERMFEVFQGSGYLGHVELKGNIRGGISQLAEKM